MTNPDRVTADDVELAGDIVIRALAGHVDADWSVPAGRLEWSCWKTVAHACDCVASYVGQLLDEAEQDYVPFLLRVEESAPPEELLRVVRVTSRMLALACRSVPESVRAHHPSGMADREGFAAMGAVELLVHGNDVARGLGAEFHVEPQLAARVLHRLLPDVAVADDDPWLVLLWAHGRVELPGRSNRTSWAWSGAPAGER